MADSDTSLYSLRYNQITSNLEAFGGGSPQWTQVVLNNVDPQQVPVTRLINTTAPLVGGGNLTADRTLSIPQATGSVNGFLLAADWTTFNNKLTSVLTSANIFVGNGSNLATGVPVTGDVTLTNTGVVTLVSVNSNVGSFTNANITVNAKGQITAAASGADTGITQLTGDVTAGPGSGSQAATLATVNGNVGTFTNTTLTVNAKGLITAASSGTTGNLTDVGTDGITITGGTGAVLGTGTSIAQHVADSTHNGYLSSTDWSTFNAKQPAGNYITALTGDATASGPGSAAITFATVNGNVGSFTNASITVNAKGLVTAASSGTAPVTSVSGTTNQINSTGGTTPVLSLSSTLVLPGTLTAGGNIIMASNKITGLAAGTTNGDAIRYEQLFTSGVVTLLGNLAFNPTTAGIVGTTTNNNAATGLVGEYIASTASGVSLTNATNTDVTSISLTAGDWDVSALATLTRNGATFTAIDMYIAISPTSGNSFTGEVQDVNASENTLGAVQLTFTRMAMTIPTVRVSLAGSATYYLKMFVGTVTAGTPLASGGLAARRVR